MKFTKVKKFFLLILNSFFFFCLNTSTVWFRVDAEEATKQSWLLDANMTAILAFGRGGHQQQQQQA